MNAHGKTPLPHDQISSVTVRTTICAKWLPLPEIESRLRSELAIALYAQGILSLGKASELADVSRFSFADLLTRREIPRHYTSGELAQDLDYARGQ